MNDNSRLWAFDWEAGAGKPVCGVDEAGRGPLAGPVCAACVLLKPKVILPELDDSKKLTPKRREFLFERIITQKLAWYGIGWASPEEIDNINILQATFLAMRRAYEAMAAQLEENMIPKLVLVDGNRDPGLPLSTRLVVKGDSQSAAIAAASVLAKVSRDRLMEDLDEEYPQYGFGRHKGYPTRAHYQALEAYGITGIHRQTFLKSFGNRDSK